MPKGKEEEQVKQEEEDSNVELNIPEKSIKKYIKGWGNDKPSILFGLYNGELYYTVDDRQNESESDSDSDSESLNKDFIIYFINKAGNEFAASSAACVISKTNIKKINIYKISRINDIGCGNPYYPKSLSTKQLIDEFLVK